MTDWTDTLAATIDARTAPVTVVGMGYVGLSLAVELARAGFVVRGIDLDLERVSLLNRGESYLVDVSAETLAPLVAAGRLTATTTFDEAGQADAIVICVPTPLRKSKEPDISFILSALESLLPHLRPGQLLVLESTTFPGTTEEVLQPRVESRGLVVGRDFFLAFSPERVDPGNQRFPTSRIPKVVGGVTRACTRLAAALYRHVTVSVFEASSPRVAETAKLLENTFRSVNIALANELAFACRKIGVDPWEVIEAAATKPFGFMPFYPGPGIGGHCLAPEEWVYCRRGDGVQPEQAGDLWQRAVASGATIHRVGDVEVLERPGVKVLGISPEGQARWEGAQALGRRWFEGEMVAVTTAGGLDMTVTDRHPMLVLSGGRLEVREARDLVPGDLIPTFSGLPEEDAAAQNPTLDVIAVLSAEQRGKTRVRLTDGSWEQHRSVLHEAAGSAARDFIHDEAVPLDLYLRLEQEGRLPDLRRRLLLMTGRGPSWSSLPAILEVTPDFARLVGYYLSEGCISQDHSPRVRFSFHADEAEYVADVIALLNRLGLRVSEHKDRNWQTLHIKVASSLLGAVMRDGLGCGRNSYEMRIPPVLLGAPAHHRLELLTGLLRGDGDVWARSGFRTYRKNGRAYRHRDAGGCIGYFSVSEQLGRGVVCLMQSLGFSPQVSRRKTQSGLRIRLHGARAMERWAPLLGGEKGRRLQESLEARQRRPRRRAVRETGAFTAVPVVAVRRFPGSTFVYSVETEDTHTFAAGFGRFVHNCIPVDPLYLSWKIRLTGYEAQFIALADQINRAMPEHVVSLVADALNDRGRPLRGSSVLVLGVTYKADVNDVRESPALEIVEMLVRKGARVSYADPYIPQIGVDGAKLTAVEASREALAAADCALILTNHSAFDYAVIAEAAPLVVDTRNALRAHRQGRSSIVTL